MEKAPIRYYDAIDMAGKLCEIPDDSDYHEVETALADRYNISLDDFMEILQFCFDRIGIDISHLTKQAYVGFVDSGLWLVKKEAGPEIINFIINWILEGEKYDDKQKGYEKVITLSGKPEFKIIITRAENEVKITKPSKLQNHAKRKI